MKNPLNKRCLREITGDAAKYVVLFLFISLTIAFVAGFIIAGDSIKKAYDENFERSRIEDGSFTLAAKADKEMLDGLGNELEVFENSYIEAKSSSESKLRVFAVRSEVNLADVHAGRLPRNSSELALDRLYADTNGFNVGDRLTLWGKEFTVCGLVSLADYSAMFENIGDMMFNTKEFGVALTSDFGLMRLEYGGGERVYCYSYRYNERLDEDERKERDEKLLERLAVSGLLKGFVPAADNPCIRFVGDDIGKDGSMMRMLFCILLVVIAFVSAVAAANTVERESVIIGTLRASGCTRGALIRHYLAPVMLVTLLASAVGNILAYTIFKDMIAQVYYDSYCLPKYVTLWNPGSFISTTVMPCLLMLIINTATLARKLSLSPLKLIRRQNRSTGGKRAVRLPNMRFMRRFRTRVILQNVPLYIILIFGIILSNTLLLFGLMFPPLLDNYTEHATKERLCDYQYILRSEVETEDSAAEKYVMRSLLFEKGESSEELQLIGLCDNSAYSSLRPGLDEAIVSKGFLKKYNLKPGETVTLKDKLNGNKEYRIRLTGSTDYSASLAVFVSSERLIRDFELSSGYFSGYLSNRLLEDIPEEAVAAVITVDDMDNVAEQMETSLGGVFDYITAAAVVIFALLMFILTKEVIERNAQMISMVKILGYKDSEIRRLYVTANTIVAFFGIMISLPIARGVINVLYAMIMESLSGWLEFYIAPYIYPLTAAMGAAAYLLVSVLDIRRIKRIPMQDALKNIE